MTYIFLQQFSGEKNSEFAVIHSESITTLFKFSLYCINHSRRHRRAGAGTSGV